MLLFRLFRLLGVLVLWWFNPRLFSVSVLVRRDGNRSCRSYCDNTATDDVHFSGREFRMRASALCCLACLLLGGVAAAAPIEIPVTADNSIVLVDREWSANAGGQGRIRIKGNQHIVAMVFDTKAIAGKRVRSARLLCFPADQKISGVTLSTIAAPWDEARSNGLTSGSAAFEGWGLPGIRFPAVMGGNSFTLTHSTATEMISGRYAWEVPPDMVHALALGIAHGIAIHEHDADYSRNPTIFAREQSGKRPVLQVELDDASDPLPGPADDLQLLPIDRGTARLTFTAPREGFAYEVTVDGRPLPRHNIPLVEPGARQTIPLRDLDAPEPETPEAKNGPAAREREVRIATLSRTGKKSSPATARAVLFRPSSIPAPRETPASTGAPGSTELSVIPVTDRYDRQGKPVGDLPADYRTRNQLFNGRQVDLVAVAGEVVGFQVLLRGSGRVSAKVAWEGEALRTDLSQAVYVSAEGRRIPDPLVPMPETLSLSPDQDTALFADVYIPFDAPAGERRGTITFSNGRSVPLRLTVLPIALPRQATFLCEMNGYGLPDHVNDYYAIQQIAYDHRVHANILHYSHNTAAAGARKSQLDMRLRSGRRMDNRKYDAIEPGATTTYWDDFAEAFGPVLDGSLFRDGHRGAIPVPGFYLTFHESWPLHCRPHFNGDPDAYRGFQDSPEYARTYVNILRDFARLARDKGWNGTGFQVYFNNKGSLHEPTKAPWILDEPSSYWDYRALQFYGELTDQGRADAKGLQIDYRIDISRPEFCRGQLQGRGDLWVVSSWAFRHYRRLVTDQMERDGLKVWVYGTSNPVHESNRNIQAWALDAWLSGASGLVPWQTVDKTGAALEKGDQLGLFIFDRDAKGETTIRHASRLKAYREAQQLIEYLHLLKAKRKWSLDETRQFVQQYVPLEGEVRKTDEADAGTASYGRLSPTGLESLKRAAGELLK